MGEGKIILPATFLELAYVSDEDYRLGNNLQFWQKSSKTAEWPRAFVSNVVPKYAIGISEHYSPKLEERHFYVIELDKWIDTFNYFLGQELKREPSRAETVLAFSEQHQLARFNLEYVLRNPSKVIYHHSEKENGVTREVVGQFFMRAEMIGQLEDGHYSLFFPQLVRPEVLAA